MKRKNKIIKVIGAFSKQELTLVVSEELSREDKTHQSEFVRRKVAKANESLKQLDEESLKLLRSNRQR